MAPSPTSPAPASPAPTSAPPTRDVPPVDTHVHVFTRALPLVQGRRHSPSGDFTPDDLFAVTARHGVREIVVVQPSFLGTDNSYLLDALAPAPERLRGIVVVDPGVTDTTLDAYAARGIVGIRLNLLGKDVSTVLTPDWMALLTRVAARGWQIEIQTEGRAVRPLLDAIVPLGAPVVIDHFGRPDPKLGVDDPGFRRLLAAGPDGSLFVKISGSYRCGGAVVAPYARALVDALGPGRLLWGSDWPHTEHETIRRYEDGLTELRSWLTPEQQAAVAETSRKLFGFAR
ncbi:amidohydrolase family protein [Rhodoplanes azumiensis]|uniref:Amidohydrolase family protein n=1 Tax=Rhodoplanes azumiensis TaxID=1897628 RepID=A0ABW5APV8_9BRAD